MLSYVRTVAGTSTERLQHLLTDADWDPVTLDRERVRGLVAASRAGGVLVVDETSLPKQGRRSVGVQRQYCGALGKKANCQAAVSVHYVAPRGHYPLALRLFLPESWVADATVRAPPRHHRPWRAGGPACRPGPRSIRRGRRFGGGSLRMSCSRAMEWGTEAV